MGKELTLSVDVERDDVEQSVTVHVGTGHDTSGPSLYVWVNAEGAMEWQVMWHDAESGSDIEQGCGGGAVTQAVTA